MIPATIAGNKGKYVNFSIGQPHFDAPKKLKISAQKAISDNCNSYTPTKGILKLREEISKNLRETRKIKTNPDNIIVTAGTSGAIFLLFSSIFDPGEEVILPDPYFVMYQQVLNFLGVKIKYLDTYPDFHINPEKLEKDEQKVIDKAKRLITDISKEFKAKEDDIAKALGQGLKEYRQAQQEANALQLCPTCKKGNLRIMYNKMSRRYFVSCSAYPACRQTYSLPPNALIKKAEDKLCEFDQFPKLLAIRKAKRPWEFCFNPDCKIEKEKREAWEAKKTGKAIDDVDE